MVKEMEKIPAETPAKELKRLIRFCDVKSREYNDPDYKENYPLTDKSRKISSLSSILEENKELFTDVEQPVQVEKKVISWAENRIDAENPQYSFKDMSIFVELIKECRRRLINYEDGLMDVTLEIRKKWEEKYE